MEYRHTLPVDCELIDEFRILGPLGSGGFANTYLAYDLTLGREVAIKEYFPAGLAIRASTERVQVKSENDEKQFRWGLNRFVREAKTLAKFRHPSVVRVFRVFDANDTAYIVLEFVRGANMETWLRSLERRPTQEELDQVLPPLLDALEVVHSAGILHRDIKPANIYIREADRQPVLLDFGAARYAISDVAGTTAAIVSKGYSPHEAYATDARMQGPWTDIYGLAATLYRALAGSAPPESTSRVLVDDCVPLAQSEELIQDYRPEFLAAIDKALSIMPQARPQAIPEWREQLFPGLAPISVPDAASLPGGVVAEWKPISDQPSDATEIVDETMTSNPVLKRLSSPSYAARIRSGSSSKGASAGAGGRDNAPAVRSAGNGLAGEASAASSSPRSTSRASPSYGAVSLSPSRSRRVGQPQEPVAAPKSINMRFAAGVILLIGGASMLFALGENGLFSGNEATQKTAFSGADRESARAAAEAEERARQERLALLAQREADEARQRAEAARAEAEAEKRRQQEQAATEKRRLQEEADAKSKAVREAQLRAEAAARRRQEEEAAQAQAREDARKRAEAERARRDREAAAAAEAAAQRARQAELDRARRENEAADARAAEAERVRKAEVEAAEERAREAARKQAEVERLRREAEVAQARAREEAETRKAEAERLKLEREAADRRAKEDEARRLAEAEQKQREREAAIARRRAEELKSSESERVRLAAQIAEERAKEEERQRLQAANAVRQREVRLAALDTTLRLPTNEERTDYVKKVQTALKTNQCYSGEVNGDIEDTSLAMVAAEQSLKSDFRRIDLARATSSDYDSWLSWMRDLRSFSCPLISPEDTTAKTREQRAKRIDRVRGAKKYRSSSRAKPTPKRTKPKKTYRSKSVSSGGSSRDSLLRSTR